MAGQGQVTLPLRSLGTVESVTEVLGAGDETVSYALLNTGTGRRTDQRGTSGPRRPGMKPCSCRGPRQQGRAQVATEVLLRRATWQMAVWPRRLQQWAREEDEESWEVGMLGFRCLTRASFRSGRWHSLGLESVQPQRHEDDT